MKKDSKKALYESIMASVAKEVKKVLNETTSLSDSLNDIKKQLIENGDGIYFVYSDHLSCDAAFLYVIRNGKIIHQEHPSCFMTRNYYGDDEPCGIIPSLNKLIREYYELNLYVANKGWYTFPQKWRECDWTTTLEKYGINSTLINIDI